MINKSNHTQTKTSVVATTSKGESFVELNFNTMEVVTIETKAFQLLMEKLNALLNAKSNANPESSEWINGKEVMQMLDITSRTLQSYRDQGLLGFTQIGRKKIFYKRADVVALLNNFYNEKFKTNKYGRE